MVGTPPASGLQTRRRQNSVDAFGAYLVPCLAMLASWLRAPNWVSVQPRCYFLATVPRENQGYNQIDISLKFAIIIGFARCSKFSYSPLSAKRSSERSFTLNRAPPSIDDPTPGNVRTFIRAKRSINNVCRQPSTYQAGAWNLFAVGTSGSAGPKRRSHVRADTVARKSPRGLAKPCAASLGLSRSGRTGAYERREPLSSSRAQASRRRASAPAKPTTLRISQEHSWDLPFQNEDPKPYRPPGGSSETESSPRVTRSVQRWAINGRRWLGGRFLTIPRSHGELFFRAIPYSGSAFNSTLR